MPFYDKNGTRMLSPFEPKGDVILPGTAELEEFRRIADATEQQARALQDQVNFAKQQAEEAKATAEKANRSAFYSRLIALGAFLIYLATFVLEFFISGF